MDDALNFADSRSNLEWQINFGGGVKSVGEHEEHDDLVLNTNSDDLGEENPNDPPTLSTPLPSLSELQDKPNQIVMLSLNLSMMRV